MSNYLNDPELLELLKIYQAHAKTSWKYKKTQDSPMVDILLRRQLLQNHLILNCYIDNNLNPEKVNVIDPTKGNFIQPLSVKDILDEIEKMKI